MVLDLKNYLISQAKSEYYSFRCTKIEVSTSKYTNADLTISLYVCIRIKIIPWKFRILNPKNPSYLAIKFVKCLFTNIQKQ